jgi:enterochelin esterase family protein
MREQSFLRWSILPGVMAFTTLAAQAPDKLTTPQLIELARQKSHNLAEALGASLGDEKLKKGTAFAGEGPDFVWAVESARPEIYIDDRAGGPMTRAGKSNLWYHTGTLQPGTVHGFCYTVNGARTGGSTDVLAYGPDSYPKPGVPQGTLSEKIVHTSTIYDGMQSNYWIYVPAQYDKNMPGALVWQDG